MFETELWHTIFRNNSVDVRPYFLYTTHNGRKIEAHLSFLGFGEKKISELSNEMNKKLSTHLGGVDANLVAIHSRKMRFKPPELKDELTIRFLSPTAIASPNGGISLMPSSSDIFAGLIRSVNRFIKYYAKSSYPVRIKPYIRNSELPLIESNLNVFTWKHRAAGNRTIDMKGIYGGVTYGLPKNEKGLEDLLALTSFFHVGKWLSYGFGKIEVVEK